MIIMANDLIMNISQLDLLYKSVKGGVFNEYSEAIRDLTKINLTNEYALIIAVDSDGGIGPLKGDTFKCDPYQLGRFAMRVPLLELLSCGARPIAAFDMLTIPMDQVGKEIVRGVRDELLQANLGDDFPLSGSTEDNVPTNTTGIGTTVIGLVHKDDFNVGKSQKDDLIVCIGIPKSAPEDTVLLDDGDIINQKDIYTILKVSGVSEVLPIGSKGAANEANQLAQTVGLKFELFDKQSINIDKSGGPSTCVIVSCNPDSVTQLMNNLKIPINIIGKLI